LLNNGTKLKIASAQLEYPQQVSMPTTELSSLKVALHKLYAFTMDTIAVQLNTVEFGSKIDLFKGTEDIKSKTIRLVHNFSFIDNPSRVSNY
jgi:tRNA nucleotidyltransferase (CCA-adding enzyme)